MTGMINTAGLACKLLQTKNKYAMLIQHGQSFLRLLGVCHTPLQVMQRTTGLVLQQCLLQNSGITTKANAFRTKVRGSCTDKAGSNNLAETSITSSRSTSWVPLHFDCEIHITATTCGRTFQHLAPTDISGLLHLALSLRQAGSLMVFRRCLREVINERLRLYHGSPPHDVQGYKDACLKLFFGHTSTKLATAGPCQCATQR